MWFWLRALTLLAPTGVVLAALWLAGEARQLEFRNDEELIVAMPTEPGPFNPLMPGTGFTREITELVFDRLLRLDDELQLQPHLANRWEYRHGATLYFLDEEKAAAAAELIEQSRQSWPAWSLQDAVHDGDMLHLVSSNPRLTWLDDLLGILDPESLAPLLHVRLKLREAVTHSLENFLTGSVEKGQLRQVTYDGDRIADLYLQGDTDLFLKELRLYYESNRGLEPEIDVVGPVSKLVALDFEIELRDDLRWHDGEPVTADDLVFTFQEVVRPGSPWTLRNAFHFAERMEKLTDYRVRVRCREYYAPALERWAKLPLLPAHLLRQAVLPATWEAFFLRPIGTGPYRLESLDSGTSMTLAANPDYFRGMPRQATVRYLNLPDPAERRMAMRLGQIDVFPPNPGRYFQEASTGVYAEVVNDVERHQNFVAWNLDRSTFSDPRVRQALAKLVDCDALYDTVSSDRVGPWSGLFYPGSWFCDTSPEPMDQDSAAAEKSLMVAGWRKSEEAWKNSNGDPLSFTLAYDKDDPLHRDLAMSLAADWKRAGIVVTLEALDWRTLVAERLVPREFDALLLGWELDFSRDQYAVWHSSEARPEGSNFSGLRDETTDRLLEKLREEDQESAVIAAATELQQRIAELQPCLFLCSTGRQIAMRGGVVRQSRPAVDGGWQAGPVSVGKAGMFASRPWWVRVIPSSPPNNPDPAPPKEIPESAP
ncbi:MAG: hypothetical protein KDN20_00045 [Verrucomicrobiae bacterium]|nr:hypothetical protein [Verrucomicrobiae bacterium]